MSRPRRDVKPLAPAASSAIKLPERPQGSQLLGALLDVLVERRAPRPSFIDGLAADAPAVDAGALLLELEDIHVALLEVARQRLEVLLDIATVAVRVLLAGCQGGADFLYELVARLAGCPHGLHGDLRGVGHPARTFLFHARRGLGLRRLWHVSAAVRLRIDGQRLEPLLVDVGQVCEVATLVLAVNLVLRSQPHDKVLGPRYWQALWDGRVALVLQALAPYHGNSHFLVVLLQSLLEKGPLLEGIAATQSAGEFRWLFLVIVEDVVHEDLRLRSSAWLADSSPLSLLGRA